MNRKRKKNNLIAVALCAIGCILIFNACTSRHLKGPKIRHWTNWEVQFKEGTTEAQKAEVLLELNKGILDSARKLRLPVKFEFYNTLGAKNFGAMRFGYSSNPGDTSVAVAPVIPVSPRPHFEFNSPFIIYTRNITDKDFLSLMKGNKPAVFK